MEVLFKRLKAKVAELQRTASSPDPTEFIQNYRTINKLLKTIFKELTDKPFNPKPLLTPQKKSNLSQGIDELDLSVRSVQCLDRLGVKSVDDLVQFKESDLIQSRNLGRKSLLEIKRKLSQLGLNLRKEVVKPIRKDDTKTQFMNMLREVNELDLSVRIAKVLKSLKVKYIGDLVHLNGSRLLEIRNFGRKSLLQLEKELDHMGLSFGMVVPGWPPKDIEEVRVKHKEEMDKIRWKDMEEHNLSSAFRINSLEEELSEYLGNLMVNKRDKQIIGKILGWDGRGPKTLESVGTEFGITRERVRQIRGIFERKVRWRTQRVILHLPIFDSSIHFIAEQLPGSAKIIETEFANQGISKKYFRLEGLLETAKILGKETPFSIVKVSRNRFVVSENTKDIPKLIMKLSKKSVEHWGVSSVSDIVTQVRQKTQHSIVEEFVIATIECLKSVRWLDKDREWFWLSSVSRNRLVNQIKKVLSVADKIDISALRANVSREYRMEGFSPPVRVLLELCNQLACCQVTGRTVKKLPHVNWEEVLDRSSTEWALAAILKEHGPIMSRTKLEVLCEELGMSTPSFFKALAYSPIITKYATGVYGLPGAKIQPGMLDSLKSRERRSKALVDYGWTSDGKIWLGHKISDSILLSGVFSIPSTMKKFLQGDFILKSSDGVSHGNVKIKGSSAWQLSSFFSRRGAELGDYFVITFEITSHEARILLGDEELLDDFRPDSI